MTAFRQIAAASVLFLGLGAVADAQTLRPGYAADAYDQGSVVTGRSTYVDRAPVTDAEADQIVMGLRVPYGPRTR